MKGAMQQLLALGFEVPLLFLLADAQRAYAAPEIIETGLPLT